MMLLGRLGRAVPTLPSISCIATRDMSGRILSLANLRHAPGAVKKRKRVGRGIGSGLGKTSGHGHQFSRSAPRGFEGGQTPMYHRLPKFGFHNVNKREIIPINISTVQDFIDKGRLTPPSNFFLTIRDLVSCGLVANPRDGVKLLARGKEIFRSPVHFEVTDASAEAVKAIEDVGGTVTCTHLNRLAMRALIKPFKFDILPRRARPNPRMMNRYLDKDRQGYLSTEVQLRNLKLFGTISSETRYREEHEAFMAVKRKNWQENKVAMRPMLIAKASKGVKTKLAELGLL